MRVAVSAPKAMAAPAQTAFGQSPLSPLLRATPNQLMKGTVPGARTVALWQPVDAAKGSAWLVQLGAFSGRETADQRVARLRSKGFSAFVREYRRDGKVLYRVRVGPEQDRNRAIAIAERLNRDGYRATVAPHP